jgi:hypothetical protein
MLMMLNGIMHLPSGQNTKAATMMMPIISEDHTEVIDLHSRAMKKNGSEAGMHIREQMATGYPHPVT